MDVHAPYAWMHVRVFVCSIACVCVLCAGSLPPPPPLSSSEGGCWLGSSLYRKAMLCLAREEAVHWWRVDTYDSRHWILVHRESWSWAWKLKSPLTGTRPPPMATGRGAMGPVYTVAPWIGGSCPSSHGPPARHPVLHEGDWMPDWAAATSRTSVACWSWHRIEGKRVVQDTGERERERNDDLLPFPTFV